MMDSILVMFLLLELEELKNQLLNKLKKFKLLRMQKKLFMS